MFIIYVLATNVSPNSSWNKIETTVTKLKTKKTEILYESIR